MTTLYLGPELPSCLAGEDVVHYPVIQIVPCEIGVVADGYTHVIFTSKVAAMLFVEQAEIPRDTVVIAVGKGTAGKLEELGVSVDAVATEETAEGVVKLLETMDLEDAVVLWPHARRARPVIADYLKGRGVDMVEVVLYDTVVAPKMPAPSLDGVGEIFFSSPSTVDGFFEAYSAIPKGVRVRCIGPVTERYLEE